MAPPIVKLPMVFDAASVAQDLSKFTSDDWEPHFNKQYYEGDWSGIALRAPLNANVNVTLYPDPTAESYADTNALVRCPAVAEILKEFKCETEAVRFLRLGAGAVIREHRDYKLSADDGLARVHVPIKTSPEIEFYLGGERVVMKEGEAWYLNFNLPHSVRNNTVHVRIHLVIDCVVNDWFRDLIAA